ncbi:hypothetical protein PMAYCL1PPCAC_09645, partial [Pristionchus mayeri]
VHNTLKEIPVNGQTMIFKGVLSHASEYFVINLMDRHRGIALHFVWYRKKHYEVVCSSMRNGQPWGPGDKKPNPLRLGEEFDIRIRAFPDRFQIFVNMKPIYIYKARL